MSDQLAQVLAFVRRTTELTADQVRPFAHGRIFSTPSIEGSWALNHVRVEAPIGAAELMALVEEVQCDLPFRRITVEPAGLTPELQLGLLRGGWRIERDLLMVLTREPDRTVDTAAVVDVSEAAHLELGRMWSKEEAPGTTDELLDELVELWSRESHTRGDRFLGILDPGGHTVLSKAKLRCADGVAQVEDVYTVPQARGRGLARALVTRAVELASGSGQRPIFIVADDDGWPKWLYERIGFSPVGRILHFLDTRPAREHRSRRRTAQRSG